MKNENIRSTLGLLVIFFGVLGSLSPSHAEDVYLKVGSGTAKFNAILQTWAVNDTTATGQDKFNFKLRRAELKLSGDLLENSRWFVMIDPAKSLSTNSNGTINTSRDNKILADLGIAYKILPTLEIIGGQFKIPTTAEGLDSSGEILSPERSYIGRTYGNTREPGMMLHFQNDQFQARTMVSNGNGTNVDDVNSEKDLHARVDYSPLKEISAGAFTTAGDLKYAKKGRWGANLRWANDVYLARFEAVHAHDSGIISNGWSADAGMMIEKFQPVLRYDGLARRNAFTGSAMTVGLNYYLLQHHSKVQLFYTGLRDMNGGGGTYSPSQNRNGSVLILAFQASI